MVAVLGVIPELLVLVVINLDLAGIVDATFEFLALLMSVAAMLVAIGMLMLVFSDFVLEEWLD